MPSKLNKARAALLEWMKVNDTERYRDMVARRRTLEESATGAVHNRAYWKSVGDGCYQRRKHMGRQ